ncbi:MAG: dienelactone hydrolase family protein [Ardenticatenales bacterium]|nr:dienelactone hydrolase family protein [Ardenticatenales bacterium]
MHAIHQNQPVLIAGKPLAEARAAMIMLHGRGSTAQSILTLAVELKQPDFAYLAPQARNNTWYPYRFLAPLARNEPFLSSALAAVADVVAYVENAGIPATHIFFLGFSQGACLALEYVARHARSYGGAIAYSGGLIGPDDAPRDYAGNLQQTPIFIGCSDVDDHIPEPRVHESGDILRRLGAITTIRIYPQMGHTINQDEIDFAKSMMSALGR